MVGWFREYRETLAEAAGYRRYLVGGICAVALAVVDAITGRGYLSWLTGVPSWATIAIVLLGSLFLWVLNYANQLRLNLKQKVSMSFEPQSPWIVRLENSNIDGRKAPSIWFRVKVDNVQKGQIAKNVRVAIVRIEYQATTGFENTEFANSQILSWSNRTEPERFAPSDLIPAEQRFVDVISVDPVHNIVHVKWPLTANWLENEHIFDRNGTYRLTVVATPIEGESTTIRLLLHWNGHWENTKMVLDTSLA